MTFQRFVAVALTSMCACLPASAAAFTTDVQAFSIAAGRLGLEPTSLVAVGVQTAGASECVDELTNSSDFVVELPAVEAQMSVAAGTVSELARTIAESGGNDAVAEQLDGAMAQLTSHHATLQNLQNAVLAQAAGGLNPEVAVGLQAWKANQGLNVPAEFRVVQLAQWQWDSILRALRAEARAVRKGQVVPEEAAALLEQIRGMPAVVEARLRLEEGLAASEAQWASIVSESIAQE